ncbi:MAG: alpha/beta hydrolase [Polyangiaceae bacterium]
MSPEINFVSANGIRFAYFEEGAGPLVLLFHGFPDTPHTWHDVRPKIAAKGYRVVAPFLRGYAPTEIPDRDADQETLARDVLALIDALGEKEAILIGHDWGATMVYGAAALGGAKIKKLFALAIPHPATLLPAPRKLWGIRHILMYRSKSAPQKFTANDFAELRPIYERWSPKWTPPDSEFAPIREVFANPKTAYAAFGYYRAFSPSVPAYLKTKIAAPAVVFSGLSDPVTDRNDYERGRKMFTGSYVIEELPGGHFLHREDPELFAKKLLAHL